VLAARGHEVVVLSRGTTASPYRTVYWDGVSPGAWATELVGSAVVNLAGELVDRRPTTANVALLRRSRVSPTRALAGAAASLDQPVPVWLRASTMAIYGDAHEAVLTEQSPVAAARARWPAWPGPEKAADGVHAQRTVVAGTSIVLDRETPAPDRLLGVTRWGSEGGSPPVVSGPAGSTWTTG